MLPPFGHFVQDRPPGFPLLLVKWSGPGTAWYVQLFVLSPRCQSPWQRSTGASCAGVAGLLQMQRAAAGCIARPVGSLCVDRSCTSCATARPVKTPGDKRARAKVRVCLIMVIVLSCWTVGGWRSLKGRASYPRSEAHV